MAKPSPVGKQKGFDPSPSVFLTDLLPPSSHDEYCEMAALKCVPFCQVWGANKDPSTTEYILGRNSMK